MPLLSTSKTMPPKKKDHCIEVVDDGQRYPGRVIFRVEL